MAEQEPRRMTARSVLRHIAWDRVAWIAVGTVYGYALCRSLP